MRMITRRAGGLLAAAVACSGVLAACTTHTDSPLRLHVTPARALFDAPVSVSVTGAAPGHAVTVTSTSVSRTGVTWRASARFTADRSGAITTAQTATSGSYRGVDAMGLFGDMAPGGDVRRQAFFYPRSTWTVRLSVSSAGRRTVSSVITRLYPTQLGVTRHELRPATDGGLYGEYERPRTTTTRRPALLVLGGSEGGDQGSFKSELLAAHGDPALALAYFHEPGLPSQLARIPIEYFAEAVAWLARQPGVDPHRIVVWGVSRGSEAALLTAEHYPKLVAGAVVTSPSDIAYGSISVPQTSAWTFGGRLVPYASGADFHSTTPLNHDALIPVLPIHGPVFAACGLADELWPSCGHVDSLYARLAGSAYPTTVLRYSGAGHFVGGLLPDVPSTETTGTDAAGDHFGVGGSPAADAAGRARGFAALLRWLSSVPALT